MQDSACRSLMGVSSFKQMAHTHFSTAAVPSAAVPSAAAAPPAAAAAAAVTAATAAAPRGRKRLRGFFSSISPSS